MTTDLAAIIPVPAPFAENAPAVFGPLAGEPPLARAVRLMLGAVAEPDRVLIPSAPSLVDDVGECLAAQGLSAAAVVVADVPGARADCVAAGLDRIGDAGYVLLHDLRWPLASTELRDRVIAALRGGSSVAVPGQPLTDSVKEVDARGAVKDTLDRAMLRTVQYPRGFATGVLAELLARPRNGGFDELDAAISAGVPITVVDGDAGAFLADLPRDAPFVEAIVTCPQADPNGS